MSKTTHDPLWGTATDPNPLSTTALLVTAEVQEFLEGIRLSFQPDDEEFANTIHHELYHELLSLPQSWETPQQGFMKIILTATTFAQHARLDLHTMQLAKGLPDPKKRKTPLPKLRKEPQDSSSFPGSPPTQEAPPPLLPKNEKSAEPEKVEKTISTSLGAQVATTTMTATTANENALSESTPPTLKNDHNTNPDYNNPDHADIERSLFGRISSIHQVTGGSPFSSPAPAPSPPALATNVKRQVEQAVEEESSDLRSQMHQVLHGFSTQLDAQSTRQRAVESEQGAVMTAQAEISRFA